MKPVQQESQDSGQATDRIHLAHEQDTKILNDEYLIQRAFVSSPKKGFEMLFHKYYTNLCNHAIRYVYSRELAEDIVAEVFTNFWNNQVYSSITSSYRAYLYTSVKNRAFNTIKAELNRNQPLDLNSDESALGDSLNALRPDEILHYHELSRKLEIAIQHLPKQSRKAFQLNRLEGKKYVEVASEMQLTVSAVERLISRALARIKEELKQEYLISLYLFILSTL